MHDALIKLPEERFQITISYEDEMIPSETLQSFTLTAINEETGLSSPVIAAPAMGIDRITFDVVGGLMGEHHHITCRVITTLDNRYEKDIFLEVRLNSSHLFYRQPYEEFSVSVDFSPLLRTGDTITGSSVSAVKLYDGTDASSVIKGSAAEPTGFYAVNLGTINAIDGDIFELAVTVTTSFGELLADRIMIIIREI